MQLFLFSGVRAVLGVLIVLALGFGAGCGRRSQFADDTASAESAPMSTEERVSALSDALSKAQNRIEELDARLSALSDRIDVSKTGITVADKTVKTEVMPSAQVQETSEAPSHSPAQNEIVASFTNAMGLFKNSKFSDAELEFHKFTENFPDHILAGSAQYYAGESYLMMGEYKLALNEYNKVLTSFGSSPRFASAMVRLAQCQKMVGKESEASKTYSVAYNLFQGNPSLDYKAPDFSGAKASAAPTSAGSAHGSSSAEKLDTGPIDHASTSENHSSQPQAGESAEHESTGRATDEVQE